MDYLFLIDRNFGVFYFCIFLLSVVSLFFSLSFLLCLYSLFIFSSGCCNLYFEQVRHLRLWVFECKSPSHQAFLLGLAAAALLGAAHVLANLLGGCMCICSRDELSTSSANKQLTVACFFFCWYRNTKSLNSLCY